MKTLKPIIDQLKEELPKLLAERTEFWEKQFGYSKIQWFFIKQWGRILYLGYRGLPSGPITPSGKLIEYVNEYIDILKGKKSEMDEMEFEEWVQEGMSVDKKILLTKETLDSIFHSCEVPLKEELTVYKTGKTKFPENNPRWISVTTREDYDYSWTGDPKNRSTYVLPKGTKVIYADGIADDNEIIIHSEELKKGRK